MKKSIPASRKAIAAAAAIATAAMPGAAFADQAPATPAGGGS